MRKVSAARCAERFPPVQVILIVITGGDFMRVFSHTVTNKYDLAAKPAMDIIKLAGEHKCRTYFESRDYVTDIDKLFILLSYGIKAGDTIKFITEGDDEKCAIDKIGKYVSRYM